MKVLNVGKGYGTYVVALLTVVWAVFGWWQGNLSPEMAQVTIFGALGVFGFRRAMK